MNPTDDEIRELFADLRAEDNARAPGFSALRGETKQRRTAARRPAPIARGWWIAAAASVVVATTVLVREVRRRDERIDAVAADGVPYPSIESWSAPTDALLRHARRATTAPPGTFRSVLDGLTNPSDSSTSFK